MPSGTVKWFDEQKGYGYLSQLDGPDIFVHYSAIAGEGVQALAEGQQVAFEIGVGPKGPTAVNVKKL